MSKTERNGAKRLRRSAVVFKASEPLMTRRVRRRLARQAGLPWGGDYQIFDAPNPNGNRHHRRHVVSVWRKYIAANF